MLSQYLLVSASFSPIAISHAVHRTDVLVVVQRTHVIQRHLLLAPTTSVLECHNELLHLCRDYPKASQALTHVQPLLLQQRLLLASVQQSQPDRRWALY